MAVKLIDGLQILFETITLKRRHLDYAHVKQIAEDFTTYATGNGIDKKLKRFNARETEEAFKQRVALTQCNTPDIVNSVIKPLRKVWRTPAQIQITWAGKDTKKNNELKKELFDAGKEFWGKKDVTKYIAQRQADLDSTDPNSFIVVEFSGKVNPADKTTKAKPYPFEVNSAEAINYIYKNNELQWLIALNAVPMVDKDGTYTAGEKYYTYIDNETITATQVHRDTALNLIANGMQVIENDKSLALKPGVEYMFQTNEKEDKDKRFFIVRVFEHKIGFVPAKRVGTVYDTTTRNRTCIPLIFAAQSYFEKSIKTMSEFDLTNCLHTFPQKVQYSDACQGEISEHGHIGCDRGFRPDGKIICGACQGSGFKVHTSAQDIIQIRMPKDLSELVSLENILVYKHPPIDLLEFQKKFAFYELRQAAQSAVYNSDVFSRQEIATTATEKQIDLDAVYDTLSPYADTGSEFYIFFYRCIASLRDLSKDLTITHEFPKDFKMRTFSELLDDLTKANTNGSPSHVKTAIVRDLIRKLYADSPSEVLKIETKNKYFPFNGKSESEINWIIANNKTTAYLAIFYAHFDLIFNEIEFEQGQKDLDFYQMEETKQREIIKAKVEEYVKVITEEADAEAAKAFEMANPDAPATV